MIVGDSTVIKTISDENTKLAKGYTDKYGSGRVKTEPRFWDMTNKHVQ